MIFATVGNATQPFPRFIRAIEALPRQDEPIIVQSGSTAYPQNSDITYIPVMPPTVFQQYIREASVVITHGGAGAILHCLAASTCPVIMPRRVGFNEHVDDHQVELADALTSQGRAFTVHDGSALFLAIMAARTAVVAPTIPTQTQMAHCVAQRVEFFMNPNIAQELFGDIWRGRQDRFWPPKNTFVGELRKMYRMWRRI